MIILVNNNGNVAPTLNYSVIHIFVIKLFSEGVIVIFISLYYANSACGPALCHLNLYVNLSAGNTKSIRSVITDKDTEKCKKKKIRNKQGYLHGVMKYSNCSAGIFHDAPKNLTHLCWRN